MLQRPVLRSSKSGVGVASAFLRRNSFRRPTKTGKSLDPESAMELGTVRAGRKAVARACSKRFQALRNPNSPSFVVSFVANFVDSILLLRLFPTKLTTKFATKESESAISGFPPVDKPFRGGSSSWL